MSKPEKIIKLIQPKSNNLKETSQTPQGGPGVIRMAPGTTGRYASPTDIGDSNPDLYKDKIDTISQQRQPKDEDEDEDEKN